MGDVRVLCLYFEFIYIEIFRVVCDRVDTAAGAMSCEQSRTLDQANEGLVTDMTYFDSGMFNFSTNYCVTDMSYKDYVKLI